MTVIAGFRCFDGVVICSDTQETIAHAKRNVPKLRYEPSGLLASRMKKNGSDLAAAFCGAGHGPFIDKLVDEAWNQAADSTSLDEACRAIEESIKQQYKEFGHIFQPGACPEVQLIYGVKMQKASRLFDATGPIINEKYGFDSGGVGHYMVDFLSERMHGDFLSVHQCVILAAYILFQTKEHVDGCGGDSHIAVLREEASSGLIDTRRVNAITETLKGADDRISSLLLSSANLDITDDEINSELENVSKIIKAYRESYKQTSEAWNKANYNSFAARLGKGPKQKDSLGLPMLSDD